MGCSCSKHAGHQHGEDVQKARDLVGSLGLVEIVEQGREAIAEAGRALDHLNRAERAAALGFGRAVSDMYRDAAKRSNRRAQEQMQTVLARIDNRVTEADWKGIVDRVRHAFNERGGVSKLANLRDEIRLHLLNDAAGVTASTAQLFLATLDGGIQAASHGDLNEVVAYARGIMANGLKGFQSPEMGRQPVGLGLLPDRKAGRSKRPPVRGGANEGWCIAAAVCDGWNVSSVIFCLIACFVTPFCGCCYFMACLGTFAVVNLGCAALTQKCAFG
jgi:hypothetical protein